MTSQRLASQPNRTSQLRSKRGPRPAFARGWTRAAGSAAWAVACACVVAVCLHPPSEADVLAGDPASIEVKPAVSPQARPSSLESGWVNPPRSARVRAYWWWLNGNVTRAAITRDLEEMKAKGWGGALICDADGASQDGNDPVKHGPTFLTPEWRALYKHALSEADRLGLEMSLNIQSGWNLGGPMVTPEDAAKKLVWSESRANGPALLKQKLLEPKSRDGFYRDL
ncbi:MAG TPA: glycosyl hydrolase, partial [Verrucomicrobiota bacterium]|nr:glycosyl hydrolase [Verrucomicrobiota bacterium]